MRPLAFLDRCADLERDPARWKSPHYLHLDRMRALCARLGHPEKAVPVLVHVAGTKGKGSTAAFAAALLKASGLRTGLYTSPHMVSWTERIAVDGRAIRPAEVEALMRPHLRWAQELPVAERPTWFEWMTALALAHFRAKRCNAAVMEVGLGGRLDATNVLTPSACILTRIDYDHEEILGSTLGKIALEKAGILKPGVPCAVAPQSPEAMRAIRAQAARVGAPIHPVRPLPPGGVRLGMLGAHQRGNAAAAVQAVRLLGLKPDLRALASVALPARVQILRRDPPLVVDGAHTPLSVAALARTIRAEFPGTRWTVILGTASDKDLAGMIRKLKGFASRILAASYGNPRARAPKEIVRAARRAGIAAGTWDGRAPEGPVCVTGSLWLAGEFLRRSS